MLSKICIASNVLLINAPNVLFNCITQLSIFEIFIINKELKHGEMVSSLCFNCKTIIHVAVCMDENIVNIYSKSTKRMLGRIWCIIYAGHNYQCTRSWTTKKRNGSSDKSSVYKRDKQADQPCRVNYLSTQANLCASVCRA